MTTDLRTNLGYKEQLYSLENFFIMERIRQTSFNAKQLINVEIELNNGVRILVRASVNNTVNIEHPSNAC